MYPNGWLKERPPWTDTNNYKPITCLPMMWKISTAQIREEIYNSVRSHGLFPEEQKGWCKGSRGTAKLLFIYQHILNESKTEKSCYGLDWLKKAYDMVPQNWIINCLKISDEVINVFEKTMKTLKEIDCKRKKLTWSEGLKRYISRRSTITVTIHNCHDTT